MPEYEREMKDKEIETGEDKGKMVATYMRNKRKACHVIICIYIIQRNGRS